MEILDLTNKEGEDNKEIKASRFLTYFNIFLCEVTRGDDCFLNLFSVQGELRHRQALNELQWN